MMVRSSRCISIQLTTPGRPKKHYSPLLCNEIRDIETLKEIEILPGGWKPSPHDLDLEFVEPDVEWFRERTLKRVYDAVEEMGLKLQGRSGGKG
jgi:hypothetical protein